MKIVNSLNLRIIERPSDVGNMKRIKLQTLTMRYNLT